MKVTSKRKFDGDWDRVLYCYHKILYWFYGRHDRSRARRFCRTLEPLLKKVDRKHESIRGEECWSLVYEVRGDLNKAIFYRRNEIRLIRRLQRFKPRFEHYGPDDLADRLDLLAILYRDAGEIQHALKALRESKRLCARNRIKFDSPDLLKEYEGEWRESRTASASFHRQLHKRGDRKSSTFGVGKVGLATVA